MWKQVILDSSRENLYIFGMKYPKSKKSAKLYSAYLSELHGRVFVPIERIVKIKNKFALNFAAVESVEELSDYLSEGWKVIE